MKVCESARAPVFFFFFFWCGRGGGSPGRGLEEEALGEGGEGACDAPRVWRRVATPCSCRLRTTLVASQRQNSEVRTQKTEVRRQNTEDRRQNTEDGSRKSEDEISKERTRTKGKGRWGHPNPRQDNCKSRQRVRKTQTAPVLPNTSCDNSSQKEAVLRHLRMVRATTRISERTGEPHTP